MAQVVECIECSGAERRIDALFRASAAHTVATLAVGDKKNLPCGAVRKFDTINFKVYITEATANTAMVAQWPCREDLVCGCVRNVHTDTHTHRRECIILRERLTASVIRRRTGANMATVGGDGFRWVFAVFSACVCNWCN